MLESNLFKIKHAARTFSHRCKILGILLWLQGFNRVPNKLNSIPSRGFQPPKINLQQYSSLPGIIQPKIIIKASTQAFWLKYFNVMLNEIKLRDFSFLYWYLLDWCMRMISLLLQSPTLLSCWLTASYVVISNINEIIFFVFILQLLSCIKSTFDVTNRKLESFHFEFKEMKKFVSKNLFLNCRMQFLKTLA